MEEPDLKRSHRGSPAGLRTGIRLCGEGATGYSFFVLAGTATVTADGA